MIIKFGIKKLFGNEPLFVINAFALGAWATGMNIPMSCFMTDPLSINYVVLICNH